MIAKEILIGVAVAYSIPVAMLFLARDVLGTPQPSWAMMGCRIAAWAAMVVVTLGLMIFWLSGGFNELSST